MKRNEKSIFAKDLNNRPAIIGQFLNRKITAEYAAKRLQLSESHIYSLAHKARKEGLNSLLTLKKRGKPPKKFSDEFKIQIVKIFTEYEALCEKRRIKPCSFAMFKKTIQEAYEISISYSSTYNILKQNGKKTPYAHRPKEKKKMHEYRERRKHEGELWLTDGSPYRWLGGDEEQTIHILEDDATGKLLGLFMTKNECFFGYSEAFKHGIKRYGLPEELASDRASVFFNSKRQKDNLSIEDQLSGISEKKTQMGEILENQLGIKMLPCFSPESKGRVERAGGTLQRRLPFLFMKHGINDIDSANKFLEKYIDEYNKEFAVEPKEEKKSYVSISKKDDLTELFSIKHHRKTDIAGVFSFHNYKFKVLGKYTDIRLRYVEIYLNAEWGMKVKIDGKFYNVELEQLDKNKKALGKDRLSIPIVWKDLFNKYLFLDAKEESVYHLVG